MALVSIRSGELLDKRRGGRLGTPLWGYSTAGGTIARRVDEVRTETSDIQKDIIMASMYILECADSSYYTGSTKDLIKRFAQHQRGEGANFTAKHLPVKLVYFEEYKRVSEAFCREKQIQHWSHAKKKALIEGRLADISKLAKKDFKKRK